jgi:hypothetical protein
MAHGRGAKGHDQLTKLLANRHLSQIPPALVKKLTKGWNGKPFRPFLSTRLDGFAALFQTTLEPTTPFT